MTTRILLDTNVMLDLLANRPEFYPNAVKLKAMAFFKDVELWVCAKSFTDIFYIMKRHFDSEAIQDLFLSTVEYIQPCSVDANDITQACTRKWSDFENCLVSVAAEKIKADYLLTRDLSGFKKSKVSVLSPAAFILKMEHEKGLAYDELIAL